jgi:GAF domain-containing protein
LDIGFVINRAVVYAGVSFVVVGVFVLVEWGFGVWFSSATHAENLTVSAVLALVLGLSVRAIHHRVNLLLDSLLFRKRHENEKALHRFAREAPYITDPSILITRTAAILEERADASFAVIEADDGAGSYGEVDENDEAIVSLRTSNRVLDLQDVNTRLPGEFAYPMIARGRLVGVLVLGSKRSGESYAPDESEAIEALAQSVGGALDVLLVKNEYVKGPILEAIRSVQASVNVIAERLRVIEERG